MEIPLCNVTNLPNVVKRDSLVLDPENTTKIPKVNGFGPKLHNGNKIFERLVIMAALVWGPENPGKSC